MSVESEKNYAFIDGQNLYLGTTKSEKSWMVDLYRFRIYLENKYSVVKAYYFLGFVNEEHQDLYSKIQEAGFVLIFREHNPAMLGKKKGNVDADIIFSVMKKLYKKDDFDKVVLVSGDGDYKMLVDFLIEEKRFEKILFPNKKFASSLYKKLGSEFFDRLEEDGIKNKIMRHKKEKGSLGS
ncbi:NYN domain-containing protein [Candidatus Azambacteria bacterium]|nr:NYN domain-containing protein [Candidatus Azambacteria bacterium]